MKAVTKPAPTRKPRKPSKPKPSNRERPVITVYLTEETIKMLDSTAAKTGQSRSQVVKGLILADNAETVSKISKLVGELADLLAVRT